ncbi:MAG: hypothetical protein E7Z84_03425 [Methanosphaera stadtmanae]|nr:hypothetical protein [Methanosphaera stadtmanae]
MNKEERKIIKSLNKLGVDTRFISLYHDNIYINNLKFSKFSHKKEDDFHKLYPHIKIVRSKLFQKICIKVSRTIKNQIKPKEILYINPDQTDINILLYILLEPYQRKYGIQIVEDLTEESIHVSSKTLDDFAEEYINLMIDGLLISSTYEENTIYPLMHVSNQLIIDWINSTDIKYKKSIIKNQTTSNEIIEFLNTHIPNVQESIVQSVKYLDENNI